MRLLMATLALAAAGCATSEVWVKDGAGQRELDMATAKCRMGAAGAMRPETSRGPGDGLMHAGAQVNYMRNCLMAEGWTPTVER